MTASAFAVILLSIIVGWPCLKLAVAFATRPLWRDIKHQRDELLSDPRVTDLDARIINGVFRESFGGPFELLAPAILALALPVLAWRSVFGHDDLIRVAAPGAVKRLTEERCRIKFDVKENPFLFSDDRFFRMADRATDLAFTRYPVSCFFGLVVIGANAPFLLFSYGFHLSFRKLVRDVANASELQSLILASSLAPRRDRGLPGAV